MSKMILGIDTSCYTSSLCLTDLSGCLLADVRRVLKVKNGERGLRQSEMVFQHSRNLPELWQQAWEIAGPDISLAAVGVSVSPRPCGDSYMPAFLVGSGYAQVTALCQQLPLYRLSHQENHICAGLWSADGPTDPEYLALHLSGGTTELVHVKQEEHTMKLQLLGGSCDLHAGQLVDRIGVLLQLGFPAGPAMETLAADSSGPEKPFPVAVQGMDVSFAGPENHAKKLLIQKVNPAVIAAGVQQCIAKSITKMIFRGIKETGLRQVLLVGGVMSNQYIRCELKNGLETTDKVKLFFPQPAYSSDNAVGAAAYALRRYVRLEANPAGE
ncbi:MAG TPA: O-sialoglycoprotein endopeptidase [Patescibacteria group bacterium]|nr:O-sialoglycoprotein endopeptidase [Patescibacteria group bacterium]